MQSVDGIMEVVEAAACAAADDDGRGSPAALHEGLARLLVVLLGLSCDLQGSGASIGPCIRAALRLQQLIPKTEAQAGGRPAVSGGGDGAAMRPQKMSGHTAGLITPTCISAVALLSSDSAKQVRGAHSCSCLGIPVSGYSCSTFPPTCLPQLPPSSSLPLVFIWLQEQEQCFLLLHRLLSEAQAAPPGRRQSLSVHASLCSPRLFTTLAFSSNPKVSCL